MIRFSPGSWSLVVAPGGGALIGADVGSDLLELIWQGMHEAPGIGPVLEGLAGAFGASLGTLPPFVVVSTIPDTSDFRVIVRGEPHVVVDSSTSEQDAVTGLGVSTWSERVFANPTRISVSVPSLATDSAVWLPIRDGVVAASALVWSLRGAQPAVLVEALPAPERTASPVPAPRPERIPEPGAVPASEPEEVREPEPDPKPEPEPLPVPAVLDISSDTVEPEAFDRTLAPVDADVADAVDPFAQPTRVEDSALPEHTTGYDDFLFGETRLVTAEDAAVRAVEVDVEVPAPSSVISGIPAAPLPAAAPLTSQDQRGDHDGETISAEQLAALQGRIAGADAPPRSSTSPRPSPVLLVSTGERIVLDRGAVIGRRPSAVRATGTLPHLVTVPSPQQDVSRRHLELRTEGDDVIAVDLDTTNGTRLLRAGADPVRLHPGEPTLLVSGDRLDLGDGIELSFEGLR